MTQYTYLFKKGTLILNPKSFACFLHLINSLLIYFIWVVSSYWLELIIKYKTSQY